MLERQRNLTGVAACEILCDGRHEIRSLSGVETGDGETARGVEVRRNGCTEAVGRRIEGIEVVGLVRFPVTCAVVTPSTPVGRGDRSRVEDRTRGIRRRIVSPDRKDVARDERLLDGAARCRRPEGDDFARLSAFVGSAYQRLRTARQQQDSGQQRTAGFVSRCISGSIHNTSFTRAAAASAGTDRSAASDDWRP